MIYAILGAVVIGLSLGVFGSGGSILTVPVLIYLLHHTDKVAIAESLAVVGAIALVSAIPYARAGWVDWRTALLFGVPGMAGTYFGAWIAAFVAGYVQLFVFAGVMVVAATRMWRRPTAGDCETHGAARRAVLKIGADGLLVGVLTGFVGVGGGFLIVPALVLLGGLSMRRAVATSLVVIALKSTAGFWKYLAVLEGLERSVDWETIGVFIVFGIAGSLLGRSLNDRLDQGALQRGFAAFLILMSGFILAQQTASLLATPTAEPASHAERSNVMSTTAQKHYETWPSVTASMKDEAPDVVKAFGTMYHKLMGEGALSLREKELIAIGIGMALRCEPCIYAHVEKAVKAGATRDQLLELGGVVVMMQGGPGYVHLPELLGAMNALDV